MKFLEFYPNCGFASCLECQAPQPLLFPKENKGFVEGCEWLKTLNFMNFHMFHGNPQSYMKFHEIS